MVFELVIVIEDEVDEVDDLEDDRDTGAAFCLDLTSSFEVELVFDDDEDDDEDEEDEEEEDGDDGRERLATCEATGDLNAGD